MFSQKVITLYTVLLVVSLTGYGWLYFSLNNQNTKQNKNSVPICLFKTLTTIPCPSCGSTRAILALGKGNFKEALHINPFGYVIVMMMGIPFWIVFDLIRRKETFYRFYGAVEQFLKKRQHTFILLLIVLTNWIWNITKGL